MREQNRLVTLKHDETREKPFASLHCNAFAAADCLHLPTNRIVELGLKVDILRFQ